MKWLRQGGGAMPACGACGKVDPLVYLVERAWLCFGCRRTHLAGSRG